MTYNPRKRKMERKECFTETCSNKSILEQPKGVHLWKKGEQAQKKLSKLSKTIQCQKNNTYYSVEEFDRLTPFYEKILRRKLNQENEKEKNRMPMNPKQESIFFIEQRRKGENRVTGAEKYTS